MRVVFTDTVPAPPETVFDTAADPELQLQWDPETLLAVEKLSSGALGRGSRYRGRFKGTGTVEYEFAEFERPRLFTHRTKVPFGTMSHRLTFEAAPEGTRLTQEGWLEPNLIGRLMTPLVGRMLRRRFPTVSRELRDYVVSQAGTPGAGR